MGSRNYLAAAAALMAMPLAAQDTQQQTPEGAQEFLRRASMQFSLANSPIESGENFIVHTNIRFEPASICVSDISSEMKWRQGAEMSLPNAGSEENLERYRAFMMKGLTQNGTVPLQPATQASWDAYFNGLRYPREVNWASVSSVETVGAKAYGAGDDNKRVVVVHAKPAFAIVAPDAGLAARIAYAMEFLRAACDMSAETGF